MPIFSLPSKYGIGDFGKSSFEFIDFLKIAKQSVWQILPLVQTGYGNSPYSSVCSFSFSPYFISPEQLYEEGLIDDNDLKELENSNRYIDYGFLYETRIKMLKKAFSNFDCADKEFNKFRKDRDFLNYAIFMAKKESSSFIPFYEWEKGLRNREVKALKQFIKDNYNEVLFWQFVQFKASEQFLKLKKYANKNGVKIFGDMPLYVALDSVDVWCNKKLFKLNKNFKPKKVAGVPPDYFCADGQLWGNPVYNYVEHKKDNFRWWTNRIKKSLKIYDLVRIDHFRGLDRFYEVDFGRSDAKIGEWKKVPSKKLIDAIKKSVDSRKIVAEDLGVIDDGVRKLLAYAKYPGMKILSFAFNGENDNPYLPKNIAENSLCFTGTHDNDTLLGLIKSLNDWDKNNLYWGVKKSLEELNISGDLESDFGLAKSIIEIAFSVRSKLTIIPMQDLLFLDSDYRINQPGIVKEQNWAVRFFEGDYGEKQIKMLLDLNKKHKRN